RQHGPLRRNRAPRHELALRNGGRPPGRADADRRPRRRGDDLPGRPRPRTDHDVARTGTGMSAIVVQSKASQQVIDVTEDVAAPTGSMDDGVCSLFTRHTTCGLTVLTNEEDIAEDLLSVLHGLVPPTAAYVHDSADHVRAHVLSALVGPSVSVPVRGGRLG